MNTKHTQLGITSLEVVIGVSIAALVIIYSVAAVNLFINTARDIARQTQALYLAEDGLELVRYIRDNNWTYIDTVPNTTTRYLSVSSTGVSIVTTPEVIGEFTRSVEMWDVSRDTTTDDVVADGASGSTEDSESRYVKVTVSWGSPTQSVDLTTLVTNIDP